MKVAILYVFHVYNEHVRFFLRHGILPGYEYFFIYHGNESIDFPYPDKLLPRENVGYDFGGWSVQLFEEWKNGKLVKDSFDYYLFVNSSVTGPFLPVYSKVEWPMIFINALNVDVSLSGITINCDKWIYPGEITAHLQSMLFCMNSNTLHYLIERGIFNPTKFITEKTQLVCDCEIGMSKCIFEKGGNIACLMKIYQGVDFRKADGYRKCDDPWYDNSVCGDNLHPYETVFFKNNRGVTPDLLKRYMQYHDEMAKFN